MSLTPLPAYIARANAAQAEADDTYGFTEEGFKNASEWVAKRGGRLVPLRTHCQQCGGAMPPRLFQIGGRLFTRSTSISIIDKDGRFCTLRCAAVYGVRQAEATDRAFGGRR